ncbi:MAG: hypothetical protein Q9183_000396 [Haloplaca sp. 2 TL-2023]
MAPGSPNSSIPFGYTFQESSDYPEERVPTPPAGPGLLDPFESEDFGQFLHGVGSVQQDLNTDVSNGLPDGLLDALPPRYLGTLSSLPSSSAEPIAYVDPSVPPGCTYPSSIYNTALSFVPGFAVPTSLPFGSDLSFGTDHRTSPSVSQILSFCFVNHSFVPCRKEEAQLTSKMLQRIQQPQTNIAHGLLSQLCPLPAEKSAHGGDVLGAQDSVPEPSVTSPKSSLHAASSSSDDNARQLPDATRVKAKLTARKGKRAARAVPGPDPNSSHQSKLTTAKAKKTTRKNAKTLEEIEYDRVKHNIKETNRRSVQADARDKLFGLVPGMAEADLLKDGQVIFFVQWLQKVLNDNERMEEHLAAMNDSSIPASRLTDESERW